MQRASSPVSIGGIQFDALIEQTPTFESQIPEFPIEIGYTISDSIINKPLVLEMVVLLSNTPVTWETWFGGASTDRVRRVSDRLLDLYVNKTPVNILTNDRMYENMGLESLKLPRKLETGDSIEIPLTFKQILYTETQTVISPGFLRSGSSGQNAGTSKTKKADSKTKQQGTTMAYNIIHGITGSASSSSYGASGSW